MDKKARLKLLYKKLLENESLTKTELADKLDLSLTAISDYINELVESRWIIPRKKADSSGGRRAVIYQINPEIRYIIALDLKDSHFYIFISDLKSNLIKSKIHYLDDYNFKNYVSEIIKVVKALLADLEIGIEKILALGISISGVTDFENKVVNRSNQLDWTDKPLASELESRLKIPVFVETDVRVYAYNELEAEDENNITTVLYIGQGIGLALIVRNRILQGYTNRVGDNRFFGERLKNLYYIIKNDEYIKEINDFTDYIASMMLSTINLLNPKKVLLTGNVFDYNDLIYNQVKEKISEGEMYHLPEIKRNNHNENPLEKALLSFLMHKFFKINKFDFTKEYLDDF